MTDLSPAAREILIAYWKAEEVSQQNGVAAALRAAANQIIEEVSPVEALFAIATELEQFDD